MTGPDDIHQVDLGSSVHLMWWVGQSERPGSSHVGARDNEEYTCDSKQGEHMRDILTTNTTTTTTITITTTEKYTD